LPNDAAMQDDVLFSKNYIVVRDGNKLHILDNKTFKERTLIKHRNYIRSIAFSPDEKQLATAAFDSTKISELSSGKPILILESCPYAWQQLFNFKY
jgi:WD40 repeat protein